MKNSTTFKAGQSYGNDLTIEVISRTEKTATIKSLFGTQRVKVRPYGDNNEAISFRSWYILATEDFDLEEARKISFENAYYR